MALTLAQIRDYARDLTGVYSTDLISDLLLSRWVNEAYSEIALSQVWSWAPVTDLTDPDEPAFQDAFHQILAYAAAVKMLAFEADDSKRAEFFAAEYAKLYENLVTHELRVGTTATSADLAGMAGTVRSLLGQYSPSIPETLIRAWINEEYQMLAAERDWRWLQATVQVELPAGTNSFTLANGSSRVLEMFIVEKIEAGDNVNAAVSYRDIVEVAPSLIDVEYNHPTSRYVVSHTGVVTISPAPLKDTTVRVRYVQSAAQLVLDTDAPLMDVKYRSGISYAVAARAALFGNAPDKIVAMCNDGASRIYSVMYQDYALSHSDEPLQMGGSSSETRRYVPWFRTA
jgi:hypothetical protein